ncbi:hypothetical protein H072_7327 [Dactylellina haptotyla CBS 200.50]|uniref:Uncharacterized protein n=1 Tax=Dactylellina haptotyla (strain CBS 200.50) TaxID=1284197 RepID=S8ACW2_DACHA|nr:hypothetical protein H072_7327 [Dactylellina haptotyla CBS 200.50]
MKITAVILALVATVIASPAANPSELDLAKAIAPHWHPAHALEFVQVRPAQAARSPAITLDIPSVSATTAKYTKLRDSKTPAQL